MPLLIDTYHYCCKQENATCVTTFPHQFIQKCKFFMFDIIYGWKAQLLLYSNKKNKQAKVTSAQRLISKTMILPIFSWQQAIFPL